MKFCIGYWVGKLHYSIWVCGQGTNGERGAMGRRGAPSGPRVLGCKRLLDLQRILPSGREPSLLAARVQRRSEQRRTTILRTTDKIHRLTTHELTTQHQNHSPKPSKTSTSSNRDPKSPITQTRRGPGAEPEPQPPLPPEPPFLAGPLGTPKGPLRADRGAPHGDAPQEQRWVRVERGRGHPP